LGEGWPRKSLKVRHFVNGSEKQKKIYENLIDSPNISKDLSIQQDQGQYSQHFISFITYDLPNKLVC